MFSGFDVIVVGGGHAGCEAVYSASRKGVSVCLVLPCYSNLVQLSCNPSVGGIGKSHLVLELDSLGGIMGMVTDASAVHSKILNESRGPAVQAPRSQVDKDLYPLAMKYIVSSLAGVTICESYVEGILLDDKGVCGVELSSGKVLFAKTVVLAMGTFLGSTVYVGNQQMEWGRWREHSSSKLAKSLAQAGIGMSSMKTGTSPRIDRSTVDFSKFLVYDHVPGIRFSARSFVPRSLEAQYCQAYSCRTSKRTKDIVMDNMDKSPYEKLAGRSPPPRYCPSIEAKFLRFPQKEDHILFVELMGVGSPELYISGLSMSFPQDIQLDIVRSIEGFECAEILRPAYTVEYNILSFGQITLSLELKDVPGLFVCGQINGTTGYEEAAVQGFVAGVNAANRVKGQAPYIPSRNVSYIGVLVDDLVHKHHIEPYRMLTSRTPWRLIFRPDNTDIRLYKEAQDVGVLSEQELLCMGEKNIMLERMMENLRSNYLSYQGRQVLLGDMLKRPDMDYKTLMTMYPEYYKDCGESINNTLYMNFKYEGYIAQVMKEWDSVQKYEKVLISPDIDFTILNMIANATKDHLIRLQPKNLGQVSRIAGITSAEFCTVVAELSKQKKLIFSENH